MVCRKASDEAARHGFKSIAFCYKKNVSRIDVAFAVSANNCSDAIVLIRFGNRADGKIVEWPATELPPQAGIRGGGCGEI